MLGTDELRATTPPDRMPSDADLGAVRIEVSRELGAGCRALPREAYTCGMAAKTTAELTACHSTRNSSTSNSSVAPGGIRPPAPRSP